MVKPKRTTLEKMQEGTGKKIAQVFFLYYFPPSIATEIYYPNAWKMRNEKKKQSFVMPIIHNYLAEWKKEGFIEAKDMKIPIKKEKAKPYTIDGKGYRLNLEPLYCYCKEKNNMEFTQEEKVFLDSLFFHKPIRLLVLREYPKEDIMNAILKFYVKYFALSNIPFPKIENSTKNSKEILNKDEIKFLNILSKREREVTKNIQGVMGYDWYGEFKKSIPKEKLIYSAKFMQDSNFVKNINTKFMKALGIA